ncbi:hypothetical protein CXB51_007906 [Gossypium anomalum]|uniref:DYW domain-containing protein n=1 Tax=Gossypium anomalum TaxID=47600 RepID=A0A8J6D6C8_9ROSI|nr:hypothetical protein CXB51_007906 [Gossypium anomalum]
MNNAPHHCLSLLTSCKTLKILKQIHASLVKTGHHSDPFFAGKLILHSAVTVPGALHYARRFFLNFPNPDVFMYNTLIRGFSESGIPQNSIFTFIDMCGKSLVPPDSFSFAFVLKAAANHGSLRTGIQLHCQALIHGFETHLFVGTTLISMYGECGSVYFAKKVFDQMREPNVVAWNAVITACFRCGDVKGARKMFDMMPFKNSTSSNVMLAGYAKAGEMELARKVFWEMKVKDDVSWSTMIVGLAHNGFFDEAFAYFRELRMIGLRPNEVSLTGVLSGCAQVGASEFGKIFHGFIEKSGFNWITTVNNALVDMYARCGNVGMARLVFRSILHKSVVSWTSMIEGLAMHGYAEEAIRVFHEMEGCGIRPDWITFVSLLYACSHAGLIEQGCNYFSRMKDVYDIEPMVEHYGCMVDLYGRAGYLQKAYDFVCQMPITPNAIIWRTLLGACGIHGNVELAEQVKARLFDLEPDDSSDNVLLSNIYAVAGKWKDVATVRRSMTDQKIKKTPGWSMIEVDRTMYRFVAGEKTNKTTAEAYEKLKEIIKRLRLEGGYVPEVASVLHDVDEEEKEDSVSKHSEKLAVAFGISRLCKGGDCHTVMKLISKIEVGFTHSMMALVLAKITGDLRRNSSLQLLECHQFWHILNRKQRSRQKEASPEPAEANPPTEDMDLENLDSSAQNPNAGDDANGDPKSKRGREEDGEETEDVSKKQKLEKSVEEERLEKKSDESPESGRVRLGPKEFGSSSEMLDYFCYLLHHWGTQLNFNKYEHMVLLDLLKKGHLEPERKIGGGVKAFQIRNHPQWKSKCFFVIRNDETMDDFSFRKCIDHILPLPEDLKGKSDSNRASGGGGGWRGRGGKGGGRGRGKGAMLWDLPIITGSVR